MKRIFALLITLLIFAPLLGQKIDLQKGEFFLTQEKALSETTQIKKEIMRINYANIGESNKSATDSAGPRAHLFEANYSTEMRKAGIGLHPSSTGSLSARARVGVNFTSPITGESSNATMGIMGRIKGSIDNALTDGSVEIVAIVKDSTTNECWSKQLFYRDATKENIDMPFNATINFLLKEDHEYITYVEIKGYQDSAFITGKIDFFSRDYGVGYDEMIVWAYFPERVLHKYKPCRPR